MTGRGGTCPRAVKRLHPGTTDPPVALPTCTRCGGTDERRMIGLMTHWFGPFAGVEPDTGYFYLCPRCCRTFVEPHIQAVRERLAELHPAMRKRGGGAGTGRRGAGEGAETPLAEPGGPGADEAPPPESGGPGADEAPPTDDEGAGGETGPDRTSAA